VRTTLTLDDDVDAKLKEEMRRSGRSFKETVNEVLRLGLQARRKSKPASKFVVRAKPMGPPRGLSYDNVEELLDWLDGPMRR
jgi:hypothetical protein